MAWQTGNTCGTGDFQRKPVLYFYDITKCLNIQSAFTGCATRQVCMSECPKQTLYKLIAKHKVEISRLFPDCTFENVNNPCPNFVLASKAVYGRCVPEILANIGSNAELNETIQVKKNNTSLAGSCMKHKMTLLTKGTGSRHKHELDNQVCRWTAKTWGRSDFGHGQVRCQVYHGLVAT